MATLSTLSVTLVTRLGLRVKLSSLSNGRLLSYCQIRQLSSNLSDTDVVNLDESPSDYEEAINVEQLQNVSGLPPELYNRYHGKVPDLSYKTLKTRRALYAKYGSASNEDPRLLWPSLQELSEQEEELSNELPLLERIQALHKEKEAEENERLERIRKIQKNMEKMPTWIAEYYNKQKVALDEKKRRDEKKQVLLDEAREYFGYKIQANDPKFQQMMEEREEKEKKEAKQKKKDEKKKKLAAYLAQNS